MSKNKRKISKKFLKISNRLRLSVFKSNLNIYAQIIDDSKGITLVSSNSIDINGDNKMEVSSKVGQNLAKLALSKKINAVYLDRKSLRYTGRLKNLCESARESGLEF